MRVKLLKKIRKRYSIELVTVNNNSNHTMYGKKLPYYELSDNNDGLGWRTLYNYNKESCMKMLVEWIRKDYINIVRKNNLYKTTKVWYKS